MRLIALAALTLAAAPVQAFEVTHSYGGRFGVAYSSNAGQDRTHPLYEGRYSLGTVHRADNGLTFRFEMDVIVGNMPDRGPDRRPANRESLTGTFGIELQTD